MTYQVTSTETHHAIRASAETHLPIRAIIGQWTRELGISNGTAVFPGPRKNPGNVTKAHVGKVCGFLEGGSATERHLFPVFCTAAEGVKEYDWYYDNLSYYTNIATKAGGDWNKACDLIEKSPWSSDHYGGTLNKTAAAAVIRIGHVTASNIANVRAKPTRASAVVSRYGHGKRLAIVAEVHGENIGGNNNWFRVRYGGGNGRVGYIHSSVFAKINV